MKNKLIFFLVIFLLISGLTSLQLQINSKLGIVTDIDGNTYTVVKIHNQLWTSENLNVSHFRDGSSIPEIKTKKEWGKAGEEGRPGWCYYNDDPENGKKYGKLYNWFAVNDPRGLAPKGWHIPSDEEWTQLTDSLGGIENAGFKMKSDSGWKNNGNGNNHSLFNGLPGGNCGFTGEINNIGETGYWWSSTKASNMRIWVRILYYDKNTLGREKYYKNYGFSVRYIKD